MGNDAVVLNFSKELGSTDCMSYMPVRCLKSCDLINSNSLFLAILKGFLEGLPLQFKLTFFS